MNDGGKKPNFPPFIALEMVEEKSSPKLEQIPTLSAGKLNQVPATGLALMLVGKGR